jgi:flagellin-like protein
VSEVIVGGTALVVSLVLLWASVGEVRGWRNGASWAKGNPPHTMNRQGKPKTPAHKPGTITPVVGTVIMVGITVVLAAVLYVMVTSLVGR